MGSLDEIGQMIASVLRRFPEVKAAYLFGSAARGEPHHDLDIAVLLGPGRIEPLRFDSIAKALQEKVAPRGPEIDLRQLDGTGPHFRVQVLREGRMVYEADADIRLAFEAQSMSEWLDFRPTWEHMRRAMLDRWIHG